MKVVATTLCLISSLMAGGVAQAAGQPLDGIAAIVNEEPITRHELRSAVAPFVSKIEADGTILSAAQRQEMAEKVLERLVDDLLILDEARRMGIEAKPAQVDAQVNRLKTTNDWTDAELARALLANGFASIVAYRKHMERELMRNQVLSIKVNAHVTLDGEDVKRAFAAAVKEGQVQQRRAAHILLRLDDLLSEAKERRFRTELEAFRKRILAGDATFEELAREHSQDGSAPAGGDLGWFGRGDLDPTFETAVFSLQKGEISKPVRTGFGLHLIKVTGIRTKALVDEEEQETLKRQIRFRLRERERERLYDRWLAELRDAAYIERR